MKARLTIAWSIRIDSSVVYHQIPSRTNSISSSAPITSLRGRKPASLISRCSSSLVALDRRPLAGELELGDVAVDRS